MMAQMEYQAQEITEKIGQLKALKEEMEKKEQLFEECSRQLQVFYIPVVFGSLKNYYVVEKPAPALDKAPL